jgi:cytidylate kinase
MRAHPRVAIDGAAGTGKSTIGERLARRLGCPYVDTGAFYRTLTAVALDAGIAPEDAEALRALAEHMAITIVPPVIRDGRQYTVLVHGVDYTQKLRTPAVEAAVSRVSRHPAVRTALIGRMRELANERGVVMVGRDIGTVVLPDADLKVFLVTALQERAKRRHGDLAALYGAAAPALETVQEEIAQRDTLDAPNMQVAPDAVQIDNTTLEADDVVARVLQILAEL